MLASKEQVTFEETYFALWFMLARLLHTVMWSETEINERNIYVLKAISRIQAVHRQRLVLTYNYVVQFEIIVDKSCVVDLLQHIKHFNPQMVHADLRYLVAFPLFKPMVEVLAECCHYVIRIELMSILSIIVCYQ